MKPHPSRTVAVLDIDGVLCNDTHRHGLLPPLDHPRRTDHADEAWRAYYAAAAGDTPVEGMILVARGLATLGFELNLATGRPESLREVTRAWMTQHLVPVSRLLMRPEGDHRPNAEMKLQHAHTIGVERIGLWVDDHPAVPTTLAGLGFPVIGLHNPSWLAAPDPEGAGR